jgi:hypothetical protein
MEDRQPPNAEVRPENGGIEKQPATEIEGSVMAEVRWNEGHRAAELNYWANQNMIATIGVTATIIAGILAGAAYLQSRREADAAQGQLDVLRDQQRPWLQPKFKLLTIAKTPEALVYTSKLDVLNSGNTVAQFVIAVAVLVPEPRGPQAVTEAHRTCAEQTRNWNKLIKVLNYRSIFPNETKPQGGIGSGTLRFKDYGYPSEIGLEVDGCITYGGYDPSTLHQTEFRYLVSNKDTPDEYACSLVFPMSGPGSTIFDASTLKVVELETIAY